MMTQGQRSAVRQLEYEPYGRELVNTGTVDDTYRLADALLDSESGLYHTL